MSVAVVYLYVRYGCKVHACIDEG